MAEGYCQVRDNRQYKTTWRRECDWDPTFSEFGVIILLERLRPGSNWGAEDVRKSVSVSWCVTRSCEYKGSNWGRS